LALLLVPLALAAAFALTRGRMSFRRDGTTNRLDLLTAAANAFRAKQIDHAAALLDQRAAEVTPTALDWLLRAYIAEARGQLDEGLEDLGRISDSDQYAAQAWLKRGQIELARHHAKAAEAAYLRALKLNADQIQAYVELAYVYAIQLRRAECDAQYRAIARRVDVGRVLAFAWCQNFTRIWDPYEARKALIPWLAADPSDRLSRLALGWSYELTYELAAADAAIKDLPDSDADALALRVRLAMDRGDRAGAEALARSGPADHARLNTLRGQLAQQRGNAREAERSFRAALEAEPDDRDAIHGLGQALRTLGNPEFRTFLDRANRLDQLRRLIQESVTSIHSDTRLFYKLGDLCEGVNKLPEARVWYQLAIARDPLDAEAQQGLARVDQPAKAALDAPAAAPRKTP
jgi:predicted Zn-dependent protease